MLPMSGRSSPGFARPSPSWPSDSWWKNSTCSWSWPLRHWSAAPCRCRGRNFGNIAGLALIILGTAMVAIAAIRFLITAKNIDSEERLPGPGTRIDIALAVLLFLLGCALFVYLSHALVATR